MIYVFVGLFFLLGIYFIVKGISLLVKLDPNDEDYKVKRKQSFRYILGGFIAILMGIARYLFWIWTFGIEQ